MAEINIDSSPVDIFPSGPASDWFRFVVKKFQGKIYYTRLLINGIFVPRKTESPEEKKKEDEKTLADLSSAHHCLQSKRQLVQTTYIKQVFLFVM